ncbi:hypothetical protein HY468_02470 [Candidatus Roizmanbacteria bacterium]|nr:hypothetical protein [Candidatus Roizmanbacteria bacterium]
MNIGAEFIAGRGDQLFLTRRGFLRKSANLFIPRFEQNPIPEGVQFYGSAEQETSVSIDWKSVRWNSEASVPKAAHTVHIAQVEGPRQESSTDGLLEQGLEGLGIDVGTAAVTQTFDERIQNLELANTATERYLTHQRYSLDFAREVYGAGVDPFFHSMGRVTLGVVMPPGRGYTTSNFPSNQATDPDRTNCFYEPINESRYTASTIAGELPHVVTSLNTPEMRQFFMDLGIGWLQIVDEAWSNYSQIAEMLASPDIYSQEQAEIIYQVHAHNNYVHLPTTNAEYRTFAANLHWLAQVLNQETPITYQWLAETGASKLSHQWTSRLFPNQMLTANSGFIRQHQIGRGRTGAGQVRIANEPIVAMQQEGVLPSFHEYPLHDGIYQFPLSRPAVRDDEPHRVGLPTYGIRVNDQGFNYGTLSELNQWAAFIVVGEDTINVPAVETHVTGDSVTPVLAVEKTMSHPRTGQTIIIAEYAVNIITMTPNLEGTALQRRDYVVSLGPTGSSSNGALASSFGQLQQSMVDYTNRISKNRP